VQNVSEEFKTAIMSPSPEFESRITFPGLALDDVQIKTIELNSLLVGSDDFEIGTAPMDMVKVELVEDTGDWGRNLFIGSISLTDTNHWGTKGSVSATDEYYMGSRIYRVNSAWGNKTYKLDTLENIEQDADYTVSVYIKKDFDTTVSNGSIYAFGLRRDIEVCRLEDLTTEWKRFSFMTKGANILNSTDPYGLRLELTVPTPAGTYVYFAGYKLEKGSIATPWTPAPEDYANYDYKNKECDIELGLTLPDESVEYVSIGKFTVENAVRKTIL